MYVFRPISKILVYQFYVEDSGDSVQIRGIIQETWQVCIGVVHILEHPGLGLFLGWYLCMSIMNLGQKWSFLFCDCLFLV